MKKWEYKIIDSRNVEGGSIFRGKEISAVETFLNDLGNEGWEIINMDFNELSSKLDFVGVAKREIQ